MAERFACPRCTRALHDIQGGGFLCAGCMAEYPLLGGIPCLVEDAPLWRSIWKSRLDDYLRVTADRLEALRREAGAPNLLDGTRQRIEGVARGLELDRAAIAELFVDFRAVDRMGAPSLFPASDSPADDPPLLQYSEHLFRDWVWGAEENERALSLVERLSPGSLHKVAVFGAGTGRLAVDIQRALAPESTLGLDLNPLPLLVTGRLLRGETIELCEFPLAPLSAEHVAVGHRLRMPFEPPPQLTLAFADALRPPISPGSLDTIVTPWFIDAVSADVREIAGAINRVLRPGGRWLNLGPLRFRGPLANLYQVGEVHDLVEGSAFRIRAELTEDVPYFRSPSSGTSRIERVYGFAAEKVGEAPSREAPHLFAPWLSDTTLPIPAGAGLLALKKRSVLTIGIANMIDGQRSIQGIAAELSAQWGVPKAVIEQELRPFLARLPID